MNKRKEYIESLAAQMGEWEVQIDLLSNKSRGPTPEEKFEYAKTIAALQLRRDEAEVKLHEVSSASDDEWEGLITGTDHLLGEIRTILRDTIMKLE